MSDLFQDKSADWDSNPIPLKISKGVGDALASAIDWTEDMEIMDFGAGTGLLTERVAARVKRLWAVDVSESMLEQLKAKPALAGRVETVCQDIVEQPLGRSFDGIISAMAMHHVQDTDALLQRFHEHLVPGGFVALADLDHEDGTFHPPGIEGVFHLGFERSALAERLLAAGFVDPTFETAVTLEKEGRDYPVFLLTATRSRE